MGRNNETTTKFKADISDLKSAMQEAKKQVAYANSEFKAVSSSLDDWSKSSDGITAKLKQLNSNLTAQEKVLKDYEGELERIKKEYGENSKEALQYGKILNDQRAVVNYIKKDISKYEDALQEVSEAEKKAAKTGRDVAEVLAETGEEAEDAGDGFTVLKGAVATFVGNGLTALVGGLRDAVGSLLGLSESTREYREDLAKLETAFTAAGFTTEQATDVYKDFYAVLGEEDRSVEAVNHLAKLVDSEKDLQTWTDICTGVWATFGDSLPIEGLTEAANETAKTGKITGGLADALNWAGQSEEEFQKKLDGLNTEQERAAYITETLNGLYSGTADEYRKNNASVLAANKAQSDYADTMAKLGAAVEPVTTALKVGFTDLLNTALTLFGGEVDVEGFVSKIQEGFGVLTDTVLPAVKDGLGWIKDNKDIIISGLTGIAAGFVAFNVANMIMSVTTSVKGFTSGLTLAQVAMKALNLVIASNPIGAIATVIALVVGALVTFIATNEDARAKFLEIWEKIKLACGNAITAIGKFFTETLPAFVQQMPEKIMTWLQVAFENVVQWGTDILNKAIEIGSRFLENVVQFFEDLPYKIGYVIGYVLGQIMQWGMDLYTFATTKIPEFIEKVIDFFKTLPGKIWTWLTNAYTKIKEWGVNIITKGKEVASDFLSNVISFVKQLPGKVSEWLTTTITKVIAWGAELAQKGKDAASDLFNNIVDTIKGLPDELADIGSDIVEGLWNGINDMTGWIKEKISSFGDGVLQGLKDFFGINSPSKLMADEVGKWLPEGIAVGISKNAKSVLGTMKDLAVDAVGSAKSGLNTSTGLGGGSVVNNFTQVINSPKQLSRLEIYRQSKNLLGYVGGAN